MEHVLKNIQKFRKQKEISHEAMAFNLDISQAAYTKLERNQTKLTVERLYKIADILEVNVADLLDIKSTNYFNQNNKESVTAYLQQTANFFNENKDQYEKIIVHYEKSLAHKEDVISELKTQIQHLRALD